MITAKELIEKLQKCNPDANVYGEILIEQDQVVFAVKSVLVNDNSVLLSNTASNVEVKL